MQEHVKRLHSEEFLLDSSDSEYAETMPWPVPGPSPKSPPGFAGEPAPTVPITQSLRQKMAILQVERRDIAFRYETKINKLSKAIAAFEEKS